MQNKAPVNELRKYIRKLVIEAIEEVTTSSDKRDDIKSDGSLWGAAFDNKEKAPVRKVDKSMWNLKYAGDKESGTEAPEAEPEVKSKPESESGT